MKILLGTDFHVGFRPKQHVTTRSAEAYEAAVLEMANELAVIPADLRIALGDVFHRYSNPETVVDQGHALLTNFHYVMCGNHDLRNNVDTLSSLQLIARLGDTTRILFTQGPVSRHTYVEGGLELTFLCHYYSQADFEAAVRSACQDVGRISEKAVLFLHCNVGDGHGKGIDAEQSSLYLTEELQDLVVEHFDLILVGHEHNHRIVKDKIVVLGNHFPLSFGEMTEKYAWILDSETLELSPVLVWSRNRYLQMTPAQLVESCEVPLHPEIQFVDIQGELPLSQRAEAARAMMKLWKTNPDLLAVRNETEVVGVAGYDKNTEVRGERSSMNFMDRVRDEVGLAGFQKEMQELSDDASS